MINIAVPGVGGRMGSAVAKQVLQARDLKLTAVTARTANPLYGKKFLNTDLLVVNNLENSKFDVLIDFTLPVAVIEHLTYCLENKLAMVIGATGFNDFQLHAIKQAAQKIPILQAANMSLGVNLCYKLLAQAAKMFDHQWDVTIVDEHHKHKKDSPSGTAKIMAQILAENSDRDLEEINIYSERQGDTIGVHTVTFANPNELVMISHVAENREIYATGALAAARWIFGKQPGLYSMLDIV